MNGDLRNFTNNAKEVLDNTLNPYAPYVDFVLGKKEPNKSTILEKESSNKDIEAVTPER